MKLSEQTQIALQIIKSVEDGNPMRWEKLDKETNSWRETVGHCAHALGCVSNGIEIRIVPKVIVINGHEVPEPRRQALPHGTVYFYPDVPSVSRFGGSTWLGDDTDCFRLSSGLIHLTAEAAELHAKALISFTQA